MRVSSPAETTTLVGDSYYEEPLGNKVDLSKLDMLQDTKAAIFGEPPSHVDIPKMTKYAEELMTLINYTGVCLRPQILRAFGPHFLSKALSLGSGIDFTPEGVMATAERIHNLQHLFKIREGQTLDDFRFPDRFYDEGIVDGPSKGRKLNRAKVQKVLQQYFEVRGWDPATSMPSNEKLAELGL